MSSSKRTFKLTVLGPPSLVDRAGEVPAALGWGKPLALLCLLAIRSEIRREEVVDLLWRDVEEDKARNAFRQALHRLRAALGEDLLPQDRLRLRLVRTAAIDIDVDRFEEFAAAGRAEDAVAMYGGDFLENAVLDEPAFDIWADQERTRLRARFRRMLELAIARSGASGDWIGALGNARRLISVAPFDSTVAQLVASTLVSAGRRFEAEQVLKEFAARLHADLGLPMPEELQALLKRLEKESGERAGNARPGGARSDLSLRFAGRESQLTQLLSLFRTTGDDAGSLALIEGDPGIGKSRLVRELISHGKSLGSTIVLVGHERSSGSQLPFGVFAEALRGLVRAPGIAGASKHLLAEAARLLPELRDSFDLPPVSDVDDEASRVRFFEGIAALIDAAAYEQPVILVLEDLHHIAPSSLDLLTYLAARLAGSAVMFVLTLRPSEAGAASRARIRALAGAGDDSVAPHQARAVHLVLTPMREADLATAAGDSARQLGLSENVVARICRRAAGIPGRVPDLLRRAASGQDVDALPVSMRDLASDQLDRLTSAQRRLFLVAALVGRPIGIPVLAAAAHMSENAARESIRVLEAGGLLEVDRDRITEISEAHAQAALETAGGASRAFLSGWIADALAADGTSTQAELARVFAQSGQPGRAFEHARRAAFSALGMGAIPEALSYFAAARSFASTPEQQSDIEGILSGLGAGSRRLPAVVNVSAAEATLPGVSSGETETFGAAPNATSLTRLFPNWRLLLGAAVATLVISAFVLWRTPDRAASPARAPSTDTLVLAEGDPVRALRFVTGDIATGFDLSAQAEPPRTEPAWVDSLARPWTGAIVSPRRQHVAVARTTAAGSDTYVISADRRDTIAVARGRGDSRPLGWSPDGRRLLATTSRTLPDGTFDNDLVVFAVESARELIVVDSSDLRSVTEAVWSPDGSRLAWVARTGAQRQTDVFVSLADGSALQNVSRHPADDQHITWSPDGELLAFTSTRDGNAELYAFSVREARLWRLTRDPAQDDASAFSANGRLIAFESTRGAAAGVYVMPALGGEAVRVAESSALSVQRWRGGRARFVDHVRVQAPGILEPGDTATLRVLGFDQFDEPIRVHGATVEILAGGYATLQKPVDSSAGAWTIVARSPGTVRVVGNVGRWRFDTTEVRVGAPSDVLGSSVRDQSDWLPLGRPQPTIADDARRTIVLNADREWESGMLSRRSVSLVPGLALSATIDAPFSAPGDAAMAVSVAIVAPENVATIDSIAPQFLRYASFSWSAEASRLVYSVGREVHTEPAAVLGRGSVVVRLRVEQDSTVAFLVNGAQRWRSTLRVITPRNESRAQLWLGGRATANRVILSEASASLAPPPR